MTTMKNEYLTTVEREGRAWAWTVTHIESGDVAGGGYCRTKADALSDSAIFLRDYLNTPTEKRLAKFEREIAALLRSLKSEIDDDFRATDDPDDNTPGMCVTVSTDDDASSWSYQTGDNSFTGGCYGDPHWAVVYLYRRSNCRELAKDAVNELADGIASVQA